ncbi:MAG TPA: hypothetical protein DD415_00265, partial [Clostridiales bacterium]|nr:hypothetical protein [Clostridiales bacterium]
IRICGGGIFYCSARQKHIVNDIDEGIRCGNSQVLHPDGSKSWFDDLDSNTAKKYIHKSAKENFTP